MKDILNNNVKNIELSGIRKISNAIDRSPNVINLTFGQPNFSTPDYIKNAGIQAIKDNQTAYTETAGLYELRQEICNYVENLYDLSYSPDDEVIVTIGASEALDLAFRTTLQEGSEVILPAPIYTAYEPLIKMCGAHPVLIDTSHNNFKLSASMIKEHITNKTRCILLPYPNNPVGSILTEKEVREIGELLKNKDIFVITDEVYSELVYDDKHFSIGAVPGMKEKSIIINGLSKSHAMTGWRVGYALAPSFLIDEFYKIHSHNAICASVISQFAALEALKQGVNREEIKTMKREYKERRDFVFQRLNELKLEAPKPEGAFYIFPSIQRTGMDSADFAEQLLEQENVAVIPGVAFSKLGEGFIRISFAQSMKVLKEGLDGIERFLNTLK